MIGIHEYGSGPQALKILQLLTARPNELVTRKDVKEALWPGQAFGDFDSRMNFAVRRLRAVLRDDAERPRYVKTVRNAGYMFIAPLRAQGVASTETSAGIGQRNAIESCNAARPASLFSRLGWLGAGSSRFPKDFAVSVAVLILLTLALLGVWRERGTNRAKAFSEQSVSEAQDGPMIAQVSRIAPAERQRIVITGQGLGLHVPYARTDSPYLAIRNKTAGWAAGRMVPYDWDEVMVDVESWNDKQIVISGFSGDYGKSPWKLSAGDEIEIAVWNPQSGLGPALYHTKVTAESEHSGYS